MSLNFYFATFASRKIRKLLSAHPVVSKYLLSISWWGQLISPNLHLSSLQIPDPHPASNLFSFLNQQNFLSTIDILWQGKLFSCLNTINYNYLVFLCPIQNTKNPSPLSHFFYSYLLATYSYRIQNQIKCYRRKSIKHLNSENWTNSFSIVAFHLSLQLFSLRFEEIPLLYSCSWVGAQVDEDQFRTLINLIFCVLIFLEAHNNSNQKQNCISKPTRLHSKLSAGQRWTIILFYNPP